ncbi:DUF2750 domain-containing protein [Streptomyces sp. NPDC058145]|uniref:DUF2750 domain-containing protein n=1 Tax=Streptomyces sp. NPDC058145 TaxID=3346356 RepID=UPI0036E415A6
MSQSGSQAAAFFRDARLSGVVWLVRDDEGSPAPLSADGTRSLPYCSTSARAQRAAEIWGHGLPVETMSLDAWRDRDLPDAAREGYMIGIDWSGLRLVGWSFTPMEVLNRLAVGDWPTAPDNTERSRRQRMSAHLRVKRASCVRA